MTSTLKEFQEKFRVQELKIFASEYWTWSVRPVHSTLGASVLSLNRFADSFGEITEDESKDLGVIVAVIENRLQHTFSPDKMNYLMLMLVDKHLHFHVIPRYSSDKHFGEQIWQDSAWPKPPALADYKDRANSPALLNIRDTLRKAK